MKIHTECIPCLLKRIIFEAKLSTNDIKIQTKVIQNACKMLAEIYNPNECSAVIATKIHKKAYDTLGDQDPYKKLKQLSNDVAKSLIPKTEEIIKKSKDSLKASMICSIIGNTLDFGIEGLSENPETLIKDYEKMYLEGLGYDDYPKLRSYLKKVRNIVYFSDNCGEIVFDKIVCKELKNIYPNQYISFVVRGMPIISDATIEDAKELNLIEVVDEILTTGCFAIGVDFNKIPSELVKTLENSELIICKGMANYEAFSETDYKPIVYLLRTKCSAISNSINIPQNISAIKFYK